MLKPVLSVIAVLTVCLAPVHAQHPGKPAPNTLSRAETVAGWMLLFDGKSTEHWRGYRKQEFPAKGWAIDGDSLQVQAGGGGGDIMTKAQFENFELSCEWKVAPKANSGIMYRVTEKHGTSWQTGPEFQVFDDTGHGVKPTDMHSAGALYDLQAPAGKKTLRPTGEYNTARIVLSGDHVRHWVNGVKVVDCPLAGGEWDKILGKSKFKGYEGFGTNRRGHIALQDHGNSVWYRNIKIRDLSAPMKGEVALFNGRDMTGWSHHLRKKMAMSDVWSVDDGVIICKGKPNGYIRTNADYDNFVLKLEWRWDPATKKTGNSGVLFRMNGADKVWPKCIEAQLWSGNAGDFFNLGDPNLKMDPARTRGINGKKTHFAENPPGEWNSYEIVVDQGDIHLTVNGEHVNAATNATELAGKICLQSEGVPIHFRNIRLAPIR